MKVARAWCEWWSIWTPGERAMWAFIFGSLVIAFALSLWNAVGTL